MVGETVGRTYTYNWADKRSRTRDGANLQCESAKFFFFCSLQYLSSDVPAADAAAAVVGTVTPVALAVPGWKQKLYLPANFHACTNLGHTHTLKA